MFTDASLVGNDPILDRGMIPIYYDGNTIKKADIQTRWYDYNNKIYANAIAVNSDKRVYYKELEPNSEININDVLAFFVWIPRYKYKLLNAEGNKASYNILGNCTGNCPQTFEVEFQNVNETSNGTSNGEWVTPPGFRFDGRDSKGVWFAKFETTGSISSPSILPNQNAINNQNLSTFWDMSRNFNNTEYSGLTSDVRLIRLSDWGIITYITYSKY